MSNYQDNEDRFSRMTAAIDERLNDVAGTRADVFISDVYPLDSEACYAMLSYAEGLPPITATDIVDFVGREFSGRAVPVLASARHFVDHNAVCLMIAKYTPTRPVADTAGMHTVVAGARYLDVEMKDTWDVATGPDGQKFLRRMADDDVVKMVAERKQNMAHAGHATLSIANALGAGVIEASDGDTVRVYWQGSVYADCEVKGSLAGNKLSVKVPKVGTITIDRNAVVEVQAVSKKSASEMKNKLSQYYKKALPDAKYASELTKDMTLDQVTDEGPSHWAPGADKK